MIVYVSFVGCSSFEKSLMITISILKKYNYLDRSELLGKIANL